MQIGNYEIDLQAISIILMILFAMTAMFFIGYRYAYGKAITYANEQIEEKIDEYKMEKGIVGIDPNVMVGNIDIPDFEVQDDK